MQVPEIAVDLVGVGIIHSDSQLRGSGMTKSELIDAVAQRTKITKSRAEQVVNCVFGPR